MSEAQHSPLVLVGVACLLLGCASWARADDPGRAYEGWEVEGFAVIGVPPVLEAPLEQGLALSGRRRLLFTRHPPFSVDLLQADVKRARLFLARMGYPEARFEPHFEPDRKRRRLVVELRVVAGTRVSIGSLELRGFDATQLPERKRWPIRSGGAFNQELIEATQAMITRNVRERGYARARTAVVLENRSADRVDLAFVVTRGSRQYFGDVSVDGVPEDLEKVAYRSVQIQRGERYSPRAVTRTEENLRYLGLFGRVQVGLDSSASDTLDVELHLSERLHRQLQTGVGYFTDDHLRLRAEWSHNNLFHEGRGLGILLRGTIYEQRASVSVWKPALLAPRMRGTVTLGVTHQDEENYEALLNGASAWITQILSLNSTLRYGVDISYSDYRAKSQEAVEFEETQGLLTALVFNWVRESARDRLWPVNGSSWSVTTRWAPDGISQAQFVLVEPDAALYREPIHRVVASGRLRLGLGGPLGDSELPPNERYHAGGASSHRGFARRKLGPKDSAEAPLGGAAKLESSAEVRFPVFRSLYGATFMDAGQVWNRMQDARLRDIEVAWGLGLMMKTPAGPVRVDYAWRLTHQDRTQPVRQFHFSIGNPY